MSKELSKTMKPSLDYLPSIELTIFVTGKKNKKKTLCRIIILKEQGNFRNAYMFYSKQSVVYLLFHRSSGSTERDTLPVSIKKIIFHIISSLSLDKNERKCSGAGTNYSLLGQHTMGPIQQ